MGFVKFYQKSEVLKKKKAKSRETELVDDLVEMG